jgi:hypothetical protein
MALSTREGANHAPKQKDTPGVGKQGDAPKTAPEGTAEPMLPEGIDPVLLHRLYPDADTIADAGAKALAQGRATKEAGEKLVAAQQGDTP